VTYLNGLAGLTLSFVPPFASDPQFETMSPRPTVMRLTSSDPSGFLAAPLIANRSAIFQNGQRLVGSRNGLYRISVGERIGCDSAHLHVANISQCAGH
jgi:hypothetical protein